MTKTTQVKEQADTPKGWSLLGAIIGAGVGAVLMKKAFDVREERSEGDGYLYGRGEYDEDLRYGTYGRDVRPYDVRTATGSVETGDLATSASLGESPQALSMRGEVGFEERGDMRERASDVAESAKGKASEMKDRVKGKAHEMKDRAMHLRDRIPDRGEMKGRASEMKGRASGWFDRTLEEQPLLLALGGIAVGMVASSLIPVTGRERRYMGQAKHQMGERISEFGDRITDKLKGEEHTEQREGRSDISGTSSGMGTSPGIEASSDRSESLSSPAGSRIPPLPPLDDVTKVH